MKTSLELFEAIIAGIPGAKHSKMFGCPCIKSPNGKASAVIWQEQLVVKPPKEQLEDLLRSGCPMFAPMDGSRTMNGWIVVPKEQSAKWKGMVEEAYEWVSALPKNK